MAGDKKDIARASQTSLTWEAPVAGDILVAPGVASIMRIPVFAQDTVFLPAPEVPVPAG